MGSLFDGIGGFILAGTFSKIDTLWSSEIDPCCEAVTREHFPYVEQLGDITKINGATVKPVDIICGGSPCQDLSIAGKRAGLAGERSGLYMEQIRIIREMRKATNNQYPRYMVWENVPGALSSNKGEDFNAVLEEAAKCAEVGVSIPEPKRKNGKIKWDTAGNIVGNGWSIAWRILDAEYWGVPQRRRRIFLVADFGSERAGEILFEQEGLRGDFTESREEGEGAAKDAERGVDGSVFNESGQGYWMPEFGCLRAEGENRPSRPGHIVCLNQHDTQSQRIYDAAGIYPCLSSNETGGQNRQAIIYEPKSAFEENWAESNVKNALRAESSRSSHCVVEKTVAAFMGGQGAKARTIAYSENVSPSIKSVLSGGNTVPDVVYSAGFNGWKSVTGTIQYGDELAPTIEANMPPNVLAVDCRNHCVNEVSATLQAKEGGGTSLNYINPVCYSITGYSKYVDQNPTLRASGGDCGGGSEGLVCGNASYYPIDQHQQDARFKLCENGIVPTMSAKMGTGGNNTPMVLCTNQELKGCWWDGGQISQTLDAVVYKGQTMPEKNRFPAVLQFEPTSGRRYIIRRLTPMECERLQGYPDGWTNITYKNKTMSDSSRYRMLGNSVAIPCVVRVLSGISDML